MADVENRDDQKIKKCLQQAYGYSDEQLLKELEEADKSVSDSDFAGAENRIFQRLMEKKAAQEKKVETVEVKAEDSKEGIKKDIVETDSRTMEISSDTVDVDPVKDNPATTSTEPEKKVVRFGKKKIFLAAALVAVLVGALGSTAIGGKNYFFRRIERPDYRVILDNDKNKKRIWKLKKS